MQITVKTALELLAHEAIVREAYKDSVGVWTWGVGVTSASGHRVHRYKDNPQPIEKCLEIFIWLLETKYAPPVRNAFAGFDLSEEQFSAALSFHYNTGGIGRATWARLWREGDEAGARSAFMSWRKPPEIIPRREKERDLFFDGKWTAPSTVIEYDVRKPSYKPDWSSAKRVRVKPALEELLNGNG